MILFTEFEPSGDAHAAPVIAELRRRAPNLRMCAWGGPKMAAAGAEIIEPTGSKATMGAGSLARVAEHYRLNQRIRRWLNDQAAAGSPCLVHIPVDSPAANFPICKITRRAGCRIVHLVAPQIWAWAPWRIGRLRRLTDHVLCLLPFEEHYFRSRGVAATFIGHPVLGDRVLGSAEKENPSDAPWRLAMLPGSRPAEIRANVEPMLTVFEALRRGSLPSLTASIVAQNEEAAGMVRAAAGELPQGVSLQVGRLDDVLEEADAALVCSGTATLDVARHGVPMVVMYRTNPLPWFAIGRWVVQARWKALPNVIAQRTIVPEFIPHFGPLRPIVAALEAILRNPKVAGQQRKELRRIVAQFTGCDPAATAAEVILSILDVRRAGA